MYSKELIEYYLDGNLKRIQREGTDTIMYLLEKGIYIDNIKEKIYRLNYYEFTKSIFFFETKAGIKECIDVRKGGGQFIPLLRRESSRIDDFIILIEDKCSNSPEYKVHEFLHFLSTEDSMMFNLFRRKIRTGVTSFEYNKNLDDGLEAINEAITDFFTFRICGKYYNDRYYKLYSENEEESPYYFPTLLINLLVFDNEIKKTKLLKAYINNDSRYVFNEIKNNFGLDKKEAKNLFTRSMNYYFDKSLKYTLRKDVECIIEFFCKHHGEKYSNFKNMYLQNFKSLIY